MPVISLKAYKDEKRERWKEEILSAVGRELDKVHNDNLEIARERLLTYASVVSGAYSQTAAELEERRRRLQLE